ncbi:MAG: histidine phosphatase family protein [Flavobacteriales bacterium]|nr:histidine phosphatase family protein [Flavobacteriales bacterium]
MKTIYLIRHAKSDWGNPGLSDFNRPLNQRGKHDAPLMGQQLRSLHVKPDLMLSSSAKRALETVTAISKELGYPNHQIQFEENIYHASTRQLAQIITGLNDELDTVALVGHNPGLTYFSNYLTDDLIDNIVTCGIVKIELEIDRWQEIIEGIGRKIYYIYPKMY